MRKQHHLCLFLLIVCLLSHSYAEQCLGYDSSEANIAAQYASCSSVTTDYLPEITAWNYTYCLSAQKDRRFIEDLSFVERRDKNLLALYLYDREKNLIVLSFRATVCGSGNANGKTDLNF